MPFVSVTGRPTEEAVRATVERVAASGAGALMPYARAGIEIDYLGEEWLRAMAWFCREAARLGLPEVTVVHANVFDFIPICHEKFDIVFADPPYALEGIDTIPDKVLGAGILHPGGYFILEHGGEYSFATHPRFLKERSYGRVHFTFFEAAR